MMTRQLSGWRLPAALLLLCATGSVVAVSTHMAARVEMERQELQRQMEAMRSQAASGSRAHARLEALAQEFRMLARRHVIGSGQRLYWIEGLERLRQARHALNLDYTIAPQRPHAAQAALGLSRMTLRLDLLHEAQLPDFFEALHGEVGGLFLLEHCAVERLPLAAAEFAATGARLRAECNGDWLTLEGKAAA